MKKNFFIVCQPGFEEELLSEITEFWPYLLSKDLLPNSDPFELLLQTTGGIEIYAIPELAYQINFFSKLASRVLQRIADFNVRDFVKLKMYLKKIEIENFFQKNKFSLQVAASQSRLNNEKRILDVCSQVFKNREEESDYQLQIRLFNDRCTVSVDTSGKHLHFRNKKLNSIAPLRETAAAFILRRMLQGQSFLELGHVQLWDAMAGSGTISMEANNLFLPVTTRDFSFQSFQSCPKIMKTTMAFTQNYFSLLKTAGFKKIIASDNSERSIDILKQNLSFFANNKILIKKLDLFSVEFKKNLDGSSSSKTWLALNPPYGERIEFKEGYAALADRLNDLRVERIGILVPSSQVKVFKSKIKYKLFSEDRFKNGGIPVHCLIYNSAL